MPVCPSQCLTAAPSVWLSLPSHRPAIRVCCPFMLHLSGRRENIYCCTVFDRDLPPPSSTVPDRPSLAVDPTNASPSRPLTYPLLKPQALAREHFGVLPLLCNAFDRLNRPASTQAAASGHWHLHTSLPLPPPPYSGRSIKPPSVFIMFYSMYLQSR